MAIDAVCAEVEKFVMDMIVENKVTVKESAQLSVK
jgi:hypothetical protein